MGKKDPIVQLFERKDVKIAQLVVVFYSMLVLAMEDPMRSRECVGVVCLCVGGAGGWCGVVPSTSVLPVPLGYQERASMVPERAHPRPSTHRPHPPSVTPAHERLL